MTLPKSGRTLAGIQVQSATRGHAHFRETRMTTDQAIAPRVARTPTTAPRRRGAPVELIAIVLLALSTLVAATAVSIGIARADMFGQQQFASELSESPFMGSQAWDLRSNHRSFDDLE